MESILNLFEIQVILDVIIDASNGVGHITLAVMFLLGLQLSKLIDQRVGEADVVKEMRSFTNIDEDIVRVDISSRAVVV
jgi:hypothetical protein